MMARNNEKIWRWARITITIGTLLVTVAVAYATLRERVNNNRGRIETVEEKVGSNQTTIVEMKADLKHLIKTTDRILEKMNDE